SGTVHGRAGSNDPDAGVFLFPADQTRWRDAHGVGRTYLSARVSKTGTFTFPVVPPGDYDIVAVADEAAATFPETKFLNLLAPAAKSIHVGPGDKQSLALTTVEISAGKGATVLDEPAADDRVVHGPNVADAPDVEGTVGMAPSRTVVGAPPVAQAPQPLTG